MMVWHICNLKKLKEYIDTGVIKAPVLGFTDLKMARRMSVQTGKKIILRLDFPDGIEPTAYSGTGVYLEQDYPFELWMNNNIDPARTEEDDFMFLLKHIHNIIHSFDELAERIIYPEYSSVGDEVKALKSAMSAFGYAPFVKEEKGEYTLVIEAQSFNMDNITHFLLFKTIAPHVEFVGIEPLSTDYIRSVFRVKEDVA